MSNQCSPRTPQTWNPITLELPTMIPLRDYLLDAYNVSRSLNRKVPTQDSPIKIDDETRGDVAYLFCQIHVQVPGRDGPGLILTFNKAPFSPHAKQLVRERGGTIDETSMGQMVTLHTDIKSIAYLRKLARTVRNAVGKGRRYADPNWIWLCPRTAASLDRFADIVMAYRTERRATAKQAAHSSPTPTMT